MSEITRFRRFGDVEVEPARAQPVQAVVQGVLRRRVQSGARLVEEQQVAGGPHERPGHLGELEGVTDAQPLGESDRIR